MEKQISVTEAKNKLPALIREVENGPPAVLTRHGKKVAVLLSIAEYDRMRPAKKGFWNALTEWRKEIEDENMLMSDSDFDGLRDRSPGRNLEVE